jgi:hypothetical protein
MIKAKHDALDKTINEAYNHYVDDLKINKLKLEKLHLKEEIDRIEHQLRTQ